MQFVRYQHRQRSRTIAPVALNKLVVATVPFHRHRRRPSRLGAAALRARPRREGRTRGRRPGSWPGANCIAALGRVKCCAELGSTEEPSTKPGNGARLCWPGSSPPATNVKLTQLPCLQHLTRSQHQAEIRRMVKDIEEQAKAVNLAKGRTPMGVAAILKQDPHSRPATTDRSPAPLSMRRTRRRRWSFARSIARSSTRSELVPSG